MKLIVFDVDGTLVDSQDLIVAAQRAAFLAHGLEPPTRERSLSIVGLSLVQAMRVLVPDGPAESLAEGYKTAFQRLRADPAYREPLFPGAAELLAELSGRDEVVLGIATGKSRRGVAHLLARHGWERVFATIQTADDHPSKPHPAMLEQALAETGAAPRDSVMIGDSTFDMAMARAAGIGAVGVSWGYHRPEALRETGAEAIVGSYRELRDHLRRTILAKTLA
ncbi:MAG: family hydrolase [Microvirga sp.]|nr:family hydrolase [Microvirga sp.]